MFESVIVIDNDHGFFNITRCMTCGALVLEADQQTHKNHHIRIGQQIEIASLTPAY